MAKSRDLQIVWVVLFAGAFWVSIWQHEMIAKLWRTVSTAAVAMTSGLRPVQPQPAPPDPEPSAKSAKGASKRQ